MKNNTPIYIRVHTVQELGVESCCFISLFHFCCLIFAKFLHIIGI
jgi:hypothetical protein